MTAEIIDQANELAQQRIDMAIAAHRLNRNAVSAEHCSECGENTRRRGALPFLAARHARNVRQT